MFITFHVCHLVGNVDVSSAHVDDVMNSILIRGRRAGNLFVNYIASSSRTETSEKSADVVGIITGSQSAYRPYRECPRYESRRSHGNSVVPLAELIVKSRFVTQR